MELSVHPMSPESQTVFPLVARGYSEDLVCICKAESDEVGFQNVICFQLVIGAHSMETLRVKFRAAC